jgi:hypothetical protein
MLVELLLVCHYCDMVDVSCLYRFAALQYSPSVYKQLDSLVDKSNVWLAKSIPELMKGSYQV